MTTGFASKQRKLAMVVAALMTVGGSCLALLSGFDIGVGVPPPWAMMIGIVASGTIAALCYFNVRGASQLLPWMCAVFVPFVVVEPGITHTIDFSYCFAILLAFGLSGPKTLVTLSFVPLVILILRAPTPSQSPYFESSTWVFTAMFSAVLFAMQRTFLAAQNTALKTESLTAAIAAASDDIAVVRQPIDGNHSVVRFVSASVRRVLGYTPASLVDQRFKLSTVVHRDDLAAFEHNERKLLDGSAKVVRNELRMRHISGQWRWLEARSVCLDQHGEQRIVTALRDISAERESREQHACEMEYQAQHDALTALPNRWRLNRDLTDGLGDDKPLSLLFCDVDSFKHVNDSLGHDVGDELLCSVANRLRTLTTPTCRLYRFGGDEFVFVDRSHDRNNAMRCAEAILATTREHMTLGANRVVLTMSVGIALAEAGQRPDDLVRNADLAMYAAKASGKNQFHAFDEDMKRQALRRHQVEQALRTALDGKQLRLVYQPKISIALRRCVGFEALLRWTSPTLGEVSPTEFIPIAEETGLIIELGHYALRNAALEMATQERSSALAVSVNVSIGQLADSERLRNSVLEALAVSGLAPQLLELEITESLFMKRPEEIFDTLQSLRSLGLRIAVDDFGTGYSSLAYLRRFPIDTLKIDRTFVKQMDNDHASRAIIAAILALSRELGLRTIAEGVETGAEIAALADLGCDEAQGFVIAKPMPLGEALAFASTYGVAVTGTHAAEPALEGWPPNAAIQQKIEAVL
jgi:diguanylate cyclase (GGDEF)-like protein/PAS domain S-box-containing protein